jgi:phosphatidylinositol alpha-mannosyltransferase
VTDPLKICLVATYDLVEEGGVKRHAVHLASQLRAGGDRVDLLAPYSGRDPLPPGTYGFRGVINIPSNGSANHMGIFACPWRVWRTLRAGSYDVVHIMEPHVPSLAWYAAWFARPAVRVATFHAYNESEGRSSKIARALLVAPQLKLFDRAIAVSPAAAEFARPVWPRPLTLIPNGIDTTLYTPPPPSLTRREGPLRLLFVGHFRDPRKGLPTLLAALERLRARGLDARLDVVGDGEHRPAPGVVYHGPIGDERRLVRFYQECDIFVAPSTGMESFGIVLLEAMACARAIACSDIVGYRNVVPADGAALVPPGDADALARALATLGADAPLRRRMGEANRAVALGFDWASLAGRVRREYLAALEARGRVASTCAPAPAATGRKRAPATGRALDSDRAVV